MKEKTRIAFLFHSWRTVRTGIERIQQNLSAVLSYASFGKRWLQEREKEDICGFEFNKEILEGLNQEISV